MTRCGVKRFAVGAELTIRSLPHTELADIAALVDYRDGQIARLILADNRALTITLTALDQEQVLPLTESPGGTMVQVLEGATTITTSAGERPLQAGEVVVLPPASIGSIAPVRRSKILITRVLQANLLHLEAGG